MAPYHRIYRVALVLLLAAVSGCGGNEVPDISAAAATELKKGRDFLGRGDFDTAIASFTEAIRLDPNYAEAYYNCGKAYSNKGEYDKAIEDYTKAIRRKPHTRFGSMAYKDRGDAYGEKGELQKAKADLDKAKSLGYEP